MPYYTIECSYQDEYSFTEQSETAMNAMLHSDAMESKDIIFLLGQTSYSTNLRKEKKSILTTFWENIEK